MGLNDNTALIMAAAQASGRGGRRQSLASVGRPYAAGGPMDPHSVGNAAMLAGMQPPLQISNGFGTPGGLQITNGMEPAAPRPQGDDEALNLADGGEARGFAPGRARQKSGPVRGPGTGTSDSIKTAVPEGSYVVPTDSVEQLGEQNIAAMGFRPGMKPAAKEKPAGPGLGFGPSSQVPVNLSNGEFILAPEQVHAIGVQVLEGLKAATHEPVEAEAQEGEEGERSRPDLFFADGGLVDDTNKRGPFDYQAPVSTPPRPGPAPIPGAERNDLPVRDSARASAGQIGAPATTKPAAPLESPVKGPLDSLGTAYGATANKLSFGAFDSRGDEIRQRNRADLIAQPEQPAAASPSPQAQSLTTNPGLTPAPTATASPTPTPAAASPAPLPGKETSVAGVRRIDEAGKSPTFTNIGPDGTGLPSQPGAQGFRPGMGGESTPGASTGLGFGPGSAMQQSRSGGVGGNDVMGILQRESQIRAGMGDLQDQINFNNGGFGWRKTGTDEVLRDLLVNGNSRDRASALGFMGGNRDANMKNAQVEQDQALRQQELEGRQNIANEELGLKREAQGFQSAAQRQIQALQEKLVAEQDPAKRNELSRQLLVLQGKAPPDRYLVAGGGQEYDAGAGALRTLPARVFDSRAGVFIKQPGDGSTAAVQNRPAGTTSTVGGRTAVWDGTKWVERT